MFFNSLNPSAISDKFRKTAKFIFSNKGNYGKENKINRK